MLRKYFIQVNTRLLYDPNMKNLSFQQAEDKPRPKIFSAEGWSIKQPKSFGRP